MLNRLNELSPSFPLSLLAFFFYKICVHALLVKAFISHHKFLGFDI